MTNTFTAVTWTNEIGQTINPGDRVLYIGTGYNHSKTVKLAKFDGVYTNDRGHIVSVRCGGIPDRQYRYDYATHTGSYKDVIRKAILPTKRVFKIANMTTVDIVNLIDKYV